MRPEVLFPLFAPVTKLPGIGPRLAPLVEKIAGPKVVDLLWHLPVGVIDRRYAPKVAEAEPGRIATLTVRVDAHVPPRVKRLPYRVRCCDDSGEIELVFFHGRPDYLKKVLPEGQTRVVSGKVDIVNPGDGSDTSVILAVDETFKLTISHKCDVARLPP